MKLAMTLALVAGLLSVSAAQAAPTAQQQRMSNCNSQAKTQALKGDARKSFMSTCLKSDAMAPAATTSAAPAAPAVTTTAPTAMSPGLSKSGKPLTAQQQKMKDCNATAKTQSLKGDARKTFMSSCLKKKA